MAKQDMSADAAWAGSEGEQHLKKGVQVVEDLRYEVAQLDLLASSPVRQIAGELVRAHHYEVLRLILTKPGHDDPRRQEGRDKIVKLQRTLVERTRTDLGIGPSVQVPPHSLLAKMLGRDQE